MEIEIKSAVLQKHGVLHGFLGKSLDFSEKNPEIEAESFRKLAEFTKCSILSANQVHTSDIVIIQTPKTLEESLQIKADGIISTVKNTAIAIKNADCVPVLITNMEKTLIAGVHSGWRGSLAGVNQNVIGEIEELGILAKDLIVSLGPSISQRNYEVQEDLYNEFIAKDGNSDVFFYRDDNGKCYFDNKRYIYNIYEKLGVGAIEMIDINTYTDEKFFSYRASKHGIISKSGTQCGFIGLV